MRYPVVQLIKEVRVMLDENTSSTAIAGLEEVPTLMLDEHIESKLEDAARIVISEAPLPELGTGEEFASSIIWESSPGVGKGTIHLPQDFLRLVSFKMSDWRVSVTDPIDEQDPRYALQQSRYAGIRGNPQRPVVALVPTPVGVDLEFYTCTGGESVHVDKARYLSIPKIKEGQIELPVKLKRSVCYMAASLVAGTLGRSELASYLLSLSGKVSQ